MAEQRIDLVAVRALLDRLPEGLEASERETGHLELTVPDDAFWLAVVDDVAAFAADLDSFPQSTTTREIGDRLQLILDTVAAYRRDVPALLAVVEAIHEEMEQRACPLCGTIRNGHKGICPMARLDGVNDG